MGWREKPRSTALTSADMFIVYYVRFLIEILEKLEQQTPRVMFSKSDEVSEAPRHAYLVHSPALRLLVYHFLPVSRFDFRHPLVGSAITIYNHRKALGFAGCILFNRVASYKWPSDAGRRCGSSSSILVGLHHSQPVALTPLHLSLSFRLALQPSHVLALNPSFGPTHMPHHLQYAGSRTTTPILHHHPPTTMASSHKSSAIRRSSKNNSVRRTQKITSSSRWASPLFAMLSMLRGNGAKRCSSRKEN